MSVQTAKVLACSDVTGEPGSVEQSRAMKSTLVGPLIESFGEF